MIDFMADVLAHASREFPNECCGYVTDRRVVACTNAEPRPDRFALDGRELFDFARSFDTDEPARIFYHSHTNGRAYLSPTDREQATAYPVQHLVVGILADGPVEAALFAQDFSELQRWVLR
ncbi:MAG: Mov34/MPN/PAD-1 family protein [Kofleriaceae bacterium]